MFCFSRPVFTAIVGCVLALFFAGTPQAQSPDLSQLQKSRLDYFFETKTYAITPGESIVLYGFGRKTFLNPSWYWGEWGSGALFGKRSGYLEGGLVLGAQYDLSPHWRIDSRLFLGAAGGGSAPQGGGFAINPTLELQTDLSHDLALGAAVGYIQFINGEISGWTVSVCAGLKQWQLHF
ncbi:MAG: hypothetical protein AB7F28_06560 [Candidatus Margulisiibacteriota bacterium]